MRQRTPWLTAALILVLMLGTVFTPTRQVRAMDFTVTNCNDSGSGSLRQAITDANANAGADTIAFSGACPLITLGSALPNITGALTITGPGASQLTIDGAKAYRVFTIGSGVTVTISGLRMQNGKSGSGGGIYNKGTLTLIDSTIADNAATSFGGGINNTGTLTITGSTITGNMATSNGAGIYNDGTLTANNSTFTSNNTLSNGGAIYNGSVTTLIHCTVAGNTANSGAGVYTGIKLLTLRNSIVAGNITGDIFGTPTSEGANLTSGDPKLGALSDNGGATQTMLPLSGSPAIDAADAAYCPTTDQRGVARPQPAGGSCDIGAVEVAPPLTVTSIARADATPTNAASVSFTVTFSTAVTGVAAGNFALTASGVTGAAVTDVSGSGTSWTVTASTGTGDGTLRLDMVNASGVTGGGAAVSNVPFTGGETYTVDQTAPTVTLTSTTPGVTNAASIPVTVAFSESVVDFTASDVSVGNGTISGFTGSGASYSLDVAPGADGAVTVDVAAGVAHDTAGNANTVATRLTRTADTGAPSVTLTSTTPGVTNAASIPVTVAFSESVADFTASDVSVGNGTISGFTGSGASYSFDVAPGADGAVTVDVAAGVAHDTAGNANTAAIRLTRTADTGAPSVTIEQAATQADPASAAPIVFAVTFSESVSGFGDADVSLSGTAGATMASVSGSGAAYTVEVSGMTAFGTVSAAIKAGGATDAAGNPSAASTSTDNTVTYVDSETPAVTIAPLALTLLENGAAQSYTVRLNSQPLAGEAVTVTIIRSMPAAVNVDQTALSFDQTTWSTPQTVTVSAPDNGIADGTRSASITHTVSSNATTPYGDGSVTAPSVALTLQDDDVPGIVLTESNGTTAVTAGGPVDTYTIALAQQPAFGDTITIALTSDSAALTVSPATLTFTVADWNVPQTTTVTASSAAGAQIAHITHTATASLTGSPYSGVSETLTVQIAAAPAIDPPEDTGSHTKTSTSAAAGSATLPVCSGFDDSLAIVRAQVPAGAVASGSVFCRILGSDANAIGSVAALDRHVQQAVDVFALRHDGAPASHFAAPIRVCVQGSGALLYLDATASPRVARELSASFDSGYTCADIPNAGTIVLVDGAPTPADSAHATMPLSGCMVRTQHILNLRAAPGLTGEVIALVPYDVTLTATQRQGAWFNVDYLGTPGWLSAAYVTPQGGCGV